MRLGRLAFILLAIYLVFIGGGAYYTLVFPIRQFHHILITVLVSLWLILRFRRGGFPATPLNWPIAAAVAVWVFSAVMSTDQRMTFENLWFLLIHVIFFFALVDLFQRGRQRMIMETVFMIGAAVVMLSGLEIASWYFGLGILPGTKVGWFNVMGPGVWFPLNVIRLALAMNISTLLAGFVAPLVTITAAWALTVRRRDYRRVLWILAAALLIVLILTFSRGGLLSILIAAGTLGALRLSQMKRVTQQIPTKLILGGAAFVGVVLVSGYVILSLTQERRSNVGDAGRLDMWRSAVMITQHYPLTGVGVGTFGRSFRDYRDATIVQDKLASAHNAYLNTAAETGLPGIIVSLWLGFVLVRSWYTNWRQTTSEPRKIRLEAAFAALLGMGVHSLVDVFTITPIVLIIVGLAAYCITPSDMVYEGQRPAAPLPNVAKKISIIAAIVACIGYGLWFFQIDRAQGSYLQSFDGGDNALNSVQAASEIDPSLHLYPLQIAYLTGQATLANPQADVTEAITRYQQALALEPTWDTGWMNLAALLLRQGDGNAALEYLDKARKINTHSWATLNWVKLAEQLHVSDNETIISGYGDAIKSGSSLPLSEFWRATPLRVEALERYLKDQTVDIQYRLLSTYDATRAAQLVPSNPKTAAEWWVAGENTLKVNNNSVDANKDFSEAIRLAPTTGDYYVSRARATYLSDPTAARRDLAIADLLGTSAEYPNALRAEMTNNPEEAALLRAQALPNRSNPQEFAAVLFNRPAQFQVFPEMQGVGPGRAAMEPWYRVAEDRSKAGNLDGAIHAYRSILDYAPDEEEASKILAELTGS
jgi:O-antigen ligase/tetratricopeptide (TPR) repeat protein